MNLNDTKRFKELDTEDMIGHINDLPKQLLKAWDLGQQLALPDWEGIERVIIAGMGGSAIGADLLEVYAAPLSPVPIVVHRDYDLPAWAKGENTLVICSSHSGNTEETLSAYEAAKAAGCRVLALTTGGKLAAAATNSGDALWQFTYPGQPRAAIHHSFGLLLAAFTRLGFVPDPEEELKGAVAAMQTQQKTLLPEIPDTANSAKRMAGQFMERWITIFGAGIMAPVARRWKTQINEIAKANAGFEFLPEANHNTMEAVTQPEKEFAHTMAIFLRSGNNHPRNQRRVELTRTAIMVQGVNTDFIEAQGDSVLANIWTALHYGDYTAYYLAMAYELDPSPVPMIEEFKGKMVAGE